MARPRSTDKPRSLSMGPGAHGHPGRSALEGVQGLSANRPVPARHRRLCSRAETSPAEALIMELHDGDTRIKLRRLASLPHVQRFVWGDGDDTGHVETARTIMGITGRTQRQPRLAPPVHDTPDLPTRQQIHLTARARTCTTRKVIAARRTTCWSSLMTPPAAGYMAARCRRDCKHCPSRVATTP